MNVQNKPNVKMNGKSFNLLGKTVKVGDKGENFTAIKNDLSLFSLDEVKEPIKIISVVPSLDTKVCQLQTVRFNEEAAKFEGVKIITISVDLPFAQARFSNDEKIDYLITISDHRDLDFGMKYGFVLEGLRLLSRGVVILDGENIIRYVDYVQEVTNQPNYDAALKAVHTLIG